MSDLIIPGEENKGHDLVLPDDIPIAVSKSSRETSKQNLDKIRFFEAREGFLILLGQRGERDHIYKLSRAIEIYESLMATSVKFIQYGIPNTDQLLEMLEDYKAKIFECMDQRRRLDMQIPKIALQFELKHRDRNTKTTVTKL